MKIAYKDSAGSRYDPRAGGGRYGNLQPYDYANWGYIILYLVSFFLFIYTRVSQPYLPRSILDQLLFKYLAIPLDAKIRIKVNKSVSWQHP